MGSATIPSKPSSFCEANATSHAPFSCLHLQKNSSKRRSRGKRTDCQHYHKNWSRASDLGKFHGPKQRGLGYCSHCLGLRFFTPSGHNNFSSANQQVPILSLKRLYRHSDSLHSPYPENEPLWRLSTPTLPTGRPPAKLGPIPRRGSLFVKLSTWLRVVTSFPLKDSLALHVHTAKLHLTCNLKTQDALI